MKPVLYVVWLVVTLALVWGWVVSSRRNTQLDRDTQLLKAQHEQEVSELNEVLHKLAQAVKERDADIAGLKEQQRVLTVQATSLKAALAQAKTAATQQEQVVAEMPLTELQQHLHDALGLVTTLPDADARIVGTLEAKEAACYEQLGITMQLNSNCEARLAKYSDLVTLYEQQSYDYRHQLETYQQVTKIQMGDLQTELKAAKGSRWQSFKRGLKYFGYGVLTGVVTALIL